MYNTEPVIKVNHQSHNKIKKFLVISITLFAFAFLLNTNTAQAAITYETPGAIDYSSQNGGTVDPTYPANVAAGDLLVLVIGMKPSSANSGSVTTPTSPGNWTLIDSITGAGGYGTTLGGDQGNTNLFAYYYEATGAHSGTLSVTISTSNIAWGQIFRFSKTTGTWSVAGTTGSDTSAGDVSVTFGANPGVATEDYVIGAFNIPTDISTPTQFSAEAFTQTGVTFGSVTEIVSDGADTEVDSNAGNDIGGFIVGAPVTSGKGTAAPVMTATAGGTTTNVRGPGIFIRVREAYCKSVVTGGWDTGSNWNDCAGVGGVPAAADDVTILGGITMTLNSATATFNSITINSSGVLDTSGSNYTLNTKSINVAGTLTANASTINLTGTSGTLFTRSGTFTQGTSEVVVTGAGTTTLLSAATTFHRLQVNNSSANVTAGAVITFSSANAANRLYIQAGTLQDGGNTIVGTANGSLVMDAAGVLKIGSAGTASTFPTNFTSFTLNNFSTIVYQAGVNQTVKGMSYNTLNITPLSGTPTMTLDATTSAKFLTISSGGKLELSTFDFTGSSGGFVDISGTFSDTSATGTNIFTSAVTINSGGVWTTTNNPAFEFRAGLTNNSSSGFTSGSGTYTFSTAAQTISGSQSFTITTLSNTITSGNGLTFSGTNPTVTTLTQGTSAVLSFSGTTLPTITTLTATATDNVVQYIGSTQTVKAATYYNLKVNASGTKTLGGTTTANGTVTVTTGTLDTDNSNNYTLTASRIVIDGGTFLARNSTINLTGSSGTLFTYSSGTFTAGTSTINVTNQDDQLSWVASGTPATVEWYGPPNAVSYSGAKMVVGDGLNSPAYPYYSTDYGATFTSVTDSCTTSGWSGFASSADGTKVISTCNGAIYRSTDSGASWTNIYTLAGVNNVASSADGTKLVANTWSTSNPIYVSTDSGTTWSPSNSITSASWNSVAISGDGSTMLASVSGGQLYTSTDNGANWTARDSSRQWKGVTVSYNGTKMAAAAFGSGSGDYIYTSTDSGATWGTQSNASGNKTWLALSGSTNGNRLVATRYGGGGGAQDKIYTTDDGGATWVAQTDSDVTTSRYYNSNGSSAGGLFVVGVSNGQGDVYVSEPATVASGTPSFYNLTFASNAGQNRLGEALTVTNDLTVAGGALDTHAANSYAVSSKTLTLSGGGVLSANASTISLTGTGVTLFTNTTGYFDKGTSTVNLTGNGSATVNSGAQTFYNLTSSGTGTKTLGGNITVENTLTISAGTFAQSSYSITLSATGTPLSVSGTLDGGSGTFYYTGDGSVTVPAAGYFNLSLTPTITSARTYTLNATAIGGAFTINPTASSALALTVNMGANLVVTGATSITGTTSGTSKLDLDPSGTDRNLTSASIAVGAAGTLDATDAASTITITGTGTVFDMNASGTINAGTTNITLTNNSASAKTFNGAGKTYYDLTLAPSTGTGTFNINGSNTFNDFEDSGTGAHTIVFEADSTTTVTSLTLDTDAGAEITLQSSNTGVAGDRWFIVDTADTNSITAVTVKDSEASGGATWDGSGGTNGGNNITGAPSWVFVTSISMGGTATGNDGATVMVAVNGLVQGQTTTISGGSWTISGVDKPTTGHIVVFWVDSVSDVNEATAITKYDGAGNITGVDLTPKILTIGSDDNQSLTLTNLDTYSCADDEDVMHSVVSSVLNVEGQSCNGGGNNSYTDETLKVLGSNTITVGSTETVTTEKINNAGTITSTTTATYNLAGTSGTLFTNSGTFTPATSTVNLTGSGDATINSGSPSFYNLTSSGTGTKSLGAGIGMASSGTLTVSAGTFDPATYTVTGSGSNSLLVSSGATLDVDASTFAGNYDSGFTTITLNSGSTTTYSLGGTQTVSSTPTYGHLTISGSGTKTLGGATTSAGTLTVTAGTLDTESTNDYALNAVRIVLNGGTLTANDSVITLSGTSGTMFSYSSGTFNPGASKIVLSGNGDVTINDSATPSYNWIDISGTGTKTVGANFSMSGPLTIGPSTFQPSTYTITQTGGSLIGAASGGVLKVNATTVAGNYDSFAGSSFDSGSTIEYARSGDQTIEMSDIVGPKLLTSGSGIKTLEGSLSYADATIGSGTTLALSSYTFTLSGTGSVLVNNGSFDAGTGTVKFTGDGAVTVPAVSYYNLNLEPTITSGRTYTLNATTVTNDFTINPTAASALALTVEMGADLTVTDTVLITGTTSGTSTLDMDVGTDRNLNAAFLNVASAGTLDATGSTSVITLNGATGTLFTKAGTFNAGSSTITVTSDAAVTLFSTSFTINSLTLSPAITASRTYLPGGQMTLNGTFTMNPSAASAYVLTYDCTGSPMTATSSDTVIGGSTAVSTWGMLGNTHMRSLTVNSGSTASFGGAYVGIYTTSGTGVTNNGTISAGTFHFLGNGDITLTSGTMTLGGIVLDATLTTNRTYTFGTGVTVTNDFTIQPAGSGELTINLRDITVGGVTTVSKSGSATSKLDAVSGSDYDLTTASLDIATGGTFLGQNSTITLTGTTGTLLTETGTFTAGGSTVVMSGASGTPTIASGTPTFNNLTISGAATKSLGEALSVGSALTISAGTLQLGAHNTTVTGTTSITGTLDDNSATGTNLFTGAVTINSGGVWTTTNDPAFEFRGGLTNNSSSGFTSGTGTYTFSTNAQTISGSQSFTITNLSNTITSGDGLTFSGTNPTVTTLTQATNSILSFSGSSYPTITTLDTTSNTPNTIKYTGTTQTIQNGITYNNLTLAGSGTKTLGGNTTVNNTITVNSGVTLDPTASYTLTGSGTNTLDVTGSLRVQASTFGGNFSSFETGTFNTGSIVDYYLNGTQTIDNTLSYDGLTLSSGGTKTLGGNTTVVGNTTVASGVTLDPTASYTLTGSGTNTLDVTGTIRVQASTFGGNYVSFETKNFNSGSDVDYYASGTQTIDNSLSYYNLKASTGGVKTLGGNTTVTNNTTVASGVTLDPTASYTLTGSGTNTLDVTGTIRVQASTFGGNYVSFETKNLNTNSTVDYYVDGAQTIDNTLSYYNLKTSTGGTKTLGGATTTTGTVNITGGTLDTGSGSNYTLNTPSLVLAGGTFLPRSSTINLTGTGTVFNYQSGTYTRSDETINITDSSSSSKTFSGGSAGSWYNASWGYRVKITVLASEVDADLTDYPVYVDLSDLPSGFHTNVNQTDARDIRVTKSDGTTEVPREVVYYDSSTDAGELHFKASGTLSGSSDTDFYIYYGNGGASDYAASDTYGSDNVWNSAFQGVYHLPNGTSLSANDSTSNSYDGTLNGSPTAGTGQLDGAGVFSGSSQDISGSGIDIASTPFTISAWIKPDAYSTDRQYFSIGSSGSTRTAIHLRQTADTSLLFGMYNDDLPVTGLSSMSGTWTHVVVTMDSSFNQTIYVNGSSVATRGAGGYFTGDTSWSIAHWVALNNEYWDGSIDEVKVSDTNRSPTWISTEYNNHSDPASFMTIGSENAYSAGSGVSVNKVVFGGTGTGDFIIVGDNNFNHLRAENAPHTLKFTADSTQTVTVWDVSGTQEGIMTLNSTSNGTDWNLYMTPTIHGFGTYSSDYLSIRDSAVTGDSKFVAMYAGENSVDDTTGGSTNSGWTFQARSRGGGGGGVESSANVGTCADGIQNGSETGIDSGGRCSGGGSQGGGSGSEGEGNTGTCADGEQNGDETGIDTGGRCSGGGGPGGGGGDVGYMYNNRYLFLAQLFYVQKLLLGLM